ncbi:MAG: hypothetical protein WDN08_18530 [Rhizomicrobium sp.]
MSVDEIEKAIVKLSPEDRAKLVARLAELDALEWDKQIEADSKAASWKSSCRNPRLISVPETAREL